MRAIATSVDLNSARAFSPPLLRQSGPGVPAVRTIAAVRKAAQQADRDAAAAAAAAAVGGTASGGGGASTTGSMQRRLVRSQLCDSARGFAGCLGGEAGGRIGSGGSGGTLTWQLGQRIGRGAFAEVRGNHVCGAANTCDRAYMS